MANPLFTLVISAYNVEKYVDKCMECIASQTFTDYEVVIVNDGSTDGTLDRLKKYEDGEKIRIISKPNGGVSSARNTGLACAKGDYIFWIDPDDYLEPDTLEKFAKYKGCDLIIGGYRLVDEVKGQSKLYLPPVMSGHNHTECVAILCKLLSIHHLFGYTWNKMYRRETVLQHGLKFQETVRKRQDCVFSYEFMQYINSIETFDEIIYNYRKNSNSITYKIVDPKYSADAAVYTRKALNNIQFTDEQKLIVERDYTNLLTYNVIECYKGRILDKETRMQYLNKLYAQHQLYPTKKSKRFCLISPKVSDFYCVTKYFIKNLIKG